MSRGSLRIVNLSYAFSGIRSNDVVYHYLDTTRGTLGLRCPSIGPRNVIPTPVVELPPKFVSLGRSRQFGASLRKVFQSEIRCRVVTKQVAMGRRAKCNLILGTHLSGHWITKGNREECIGTSPNRLIGHSRA